MVFSLNQSERVQFRIYLLLELLERNKFMNESTILVKIEREKEIITENPFRINKMKFQIQERGYLYLKEPMVDLVTVQIQFPSFLKILSSNSFSFRENSVRISLPFLNSSPLEFVCLRKGRGTVFFTLTNQQGESKYELGIVEVLE